MKKLIIIMAMLLPATSQAQDIRKLDYCVKISALSGLVLKAKNVGDDNVRAFTDAVDYTKNELPSADIAVIVDLIYSAETSTISVDNIEEAFLIRCMQK